MLTKNDLLAIKTIVKDEVKAIVKTEVKAIVRTEVKSAMSPEIKRLDNSIAELRSDMNRNNNDLVELITAGFSSFQTQFEDHEVRITHLETNFRPV